ncbi:MAG: hypothetical protein U9O54_03560, partial [Chloroflexota bacterium]|nr:hypothetical protein [Chloroflexota bacterium]
MRNNLTSDHKEKSPFLSISHYLFFLILTLALIASMAGCGTGTTDAQGNSPSGAAQTIENKGSDTLVNLALAWAEAYMELNPEVRISVTGGGSG